MREITTWMITYSNENKDRQLLQGNNLYDLVVTNPVIFKDKDIEHIYVKTIERYDD